MLPVREFSFFYSITVFKIDCAIVFYTLVRSTVFIFLWLAFIIECHISVVIIFVPF